MIIAVALAVLFITVRRFGFPLGADISKSLGQAGKGFTDFLDRLGSSSLSQQQIATKQAEEIFERQVEEKERQAELAGFESVAEFERETDVQSIFNLDIGQLDQFNPEGIIGFGIPSLSEGRGIDDTPENRQALFDILQGAKEKGIFDVRQIDFSSLSTSGTAGSESATIKIDFASFPKLPSLPRAFAEESPDSRIISDEIITTQKPTPQGSTTIEGIVRSELDTGQVFQIFSSDSSKTPFGVIRETIQDPTQLQLDSEGNPIETASERASRVFEETGQFAGESFDIITEAEKRASEFDFGTSTGTALPTDSDVELSLQERLKIEAEKALAVFDSRAITN